MVAISNKIVQQIAYIPADRLAFETKWFINNLLLHIIVYYYYLVIIVVIIILV